MVQVYICSHWRFRFVWTMVLSQSAPSRGGPSVAPDLGRGRWVRRALSRQQGRACSAPRSWLNSRHCAAGSLAHTVLLRNALHTRMRHSFMFHYYTRLGNNLQPITALCVSKQSQWEIVAFYTYSIHTHGRIKIKDSNIYILHLFEESIDENMAKCVSHKKSIYDSFAQITHGVSCYEWCCTASLESFELNITREGHMLTSIR